MRTYAITSQKGGVGKTTTTVNLGAALAREGQSVLLIDLDPQGSLTAAVGCQPCSCTIGDVLLAPGRLSDAICPCTGSMRVVTASAMLATAFIQLAEIDNSAYRLKQALESVDCSFDYVLIDCPPSLGYATTNALTAADVALVPLQCEFLSLRGLTDVTEIAEAIRESTNPNLKLRVAATMFDKRTLHARDVLMEAREALPGLVYETVIPRTVRLAEAPAMGQTILEYAPDSNGSFGYCALAREILEEDKDYGASERNSRGDSQPAYTPYLRAA